MRSTTIFIALILSVATACAVDTSDQSGTASSDDPSTSIGVAREPLITPALRRVTGQTPANPSFARTQSETAMAVGLNAPNPNPGGLSLASPVVVTAFNDWSGVTTTGIVNDHILTHSSYLGYSRSVNAGSTWTYAGVLEPFDPNFPILRGDPSAASSPTSPNRVYLGNLAGRLDQVEPVQNGPDWTTFGMPSSTQPTGICVFRSTSGGLTFAGFSCVASGSEYDGTSLAVANDETVYLASSAESAARVHVWRIDPVTGVGTLLALPFDVPTMGHPQLSYDRFTNRLYVVVASAGNILASYWNGQTWSSPIALNPPGTSFVWISVKFGAPAGLVRQGRFFTFDVAPPRTAGLILDSTRAFRFAFTAWMPSGGHGLVVGACSTDLTGCAEVPAWEPPTSASSFLFDPVLRADHFHGAGASPQVRLSWTSVDSAVATTFSVVSSRLDVSAAAPSVPLLATPYVNYATMNACPHQASSTGGGYIGDYNDMVSVPLTLRPGYTFLRAYSWSPDVCSPIAAGSANDQHVAVVNNP